MNRIKELLKKSSRFILGLAIGLTLSVGIGYAATVAGSSTTYNKSTSGLSSTNVQGAIDELYTKAKNSKTKIVNAYTYDKTVLSSTTQGTGYSAVTTKVYKCVTGNESTCVKTTCYQNKNVNSCSPGTIIDYRVNNNTTVRFHVIQDDGETMRLQSQRNTLKSAWYSSSDSNSSGPTTALASLESATAGWTNVNNQTYTIGRSSNDLGYSGCSSSYNSCSSATYSLTRGPVKARMITMQEAMKVGCTTSSVSCPVWMYNYLNGSTGWNGTNTGDNNSEYWTMSANSSYSDFAWMVDFTGRLDDNLTTRNLGVRAVVVISK